MKTKCRDRDRGRPVLGVCLGVGVLLLTLLAASPVLLSLYFWFVPDLQYLFRSLPSDEKLIANFSRHRSDFERLVQIYREDLSVPTNCVGELEPTPEIKAIMDRVNVTAVRGDNVLWMPPDPYSRDAPTLREKAKLEPKWCNPERRKFSGVFFDYGHGRVKRLSYGDDVAKGYYFIPFVPKMWKGRLIVPADFITRHGLIAQNLNTYPPGFGRYDSAYRLIQQHWYVFMVQ